MEGRLLGGVTAVFNPADKHTTVFIQFVKFLKFIIIDFIARAPPPVLTHHPEGPKKILDLLRDAERGAICISVLNTAF